MNVDALLLHLNNLSHLLREAGAAKSANELRDACELLHPFQGQKLETLVKEIEKAKQVLSNGPSRSSRGVKKITPAEVEAIAARLASLHDRAGLPGFTTEEIEETFAAANLESLTVPQLVTVAARLNVPRLRGKVKLIEAMKKAVRDRHGAILRSGV